MTHVSSEEIEQKMQSALKTENVQTIWSAFFIWLFYKYSHKRNTFLFWITAPLGPAMLLHSSQMKSRNRLACDVFDTFPHMFFSHTNPSHDCAPFWQDLKQLMDMSVKLKCSHHLLVKWLAVCLLVLRKRQMCWKCPHCFILLQKEELKLTICVFWSLFWT